jgi:hypothetical protein
MYSRPNQLEKLFIIAKTLLVAVPIFTTGQSDMQTVQAKANFSHCKCPTDSGLQ